MAQIETLRAGLQSAAAALAACHNHAPEDQREAIEIFFKEARAALEKAKGEIEEPPKPARVIVATYSHKHGEDVRVFASDDGAEAWRQEIARAWSADWYSTKTHGEILPDDPAERADAYFDEMSERGTEFFRTESCEVEPDPAPPSAAPEVYDVQTGLYVTVTSDAEQRAEKG